MYFFFCLDTKEKDTKKKKSRLHFRCVPLYAAKMRSVCHADGCLVNAIFLFFIAACRTCASFSFCAAEVRAGRRTLRRVRGQRD